VSQTLLVLEARDVRGMEGARLPDRGEWVATFDAPPSDLEVEAHVMAFCRRYAFYEATVAARWMARSSGEAWTIVPSENAIVTQFRWRHASQLRVSAHYRDTTYPFLGTGPAKEGCMSTKTKTKAKAKAAAPAATSAQEKAANYAAGATPMSTIEGADVLRRYDVASRHVRAIIRNNILDATVGAGVRLAREHGYHRFAPTWDDTDEQEREVQNVPDPIVDSVVETLLDYGLVTSDESHHDAHRMNAQVERLTWVAQRAILLLHEITHAGPDMPVPVLAASRDLAMTLAIAGHKADLIELGVPVPPGEDEGDGDTSAKEGT